MALHTCQVCGEYFEVNSPGRPPKTCLEHRAIKVPSTPRTSKGSDQALEALRVMLDTLMSDRVTWDDISRYMETYDHSLRVMGERIEEVANRPAGERKVTIEWSYDPDKSVVLPSNSHEVLPEVVQCVDAGLNLFLVGPAGSGKSTIAEQVAQILAIDFASMSVGPNTSNSKLFGYMTGHGNYASTEFRRVYEFGGVFLLDEMDNGHPGLLTEMNQFLAGSTCAFADKMVKKHKLFRMIATGNTYGLGANRQFVGRNVLDAATLDRFGVIDVPVDESLERAIAVGYAGDDETKKGIVHAWVTYVQKLRANADSMKINKIVSPRASIDGAKLLMSGMSVARAAEIRIWSGVDADTKKKLEGSSY